MFKSPIKRVYRINEPKAEKIPRNKPRETGWFYLYIYILRGIIGIVPRSKGTVFTTDCRLKVF